MNNIVYHGSPRGDIEVLKPRVSTHQKECIYATDSKAVAMMFMGRGNGDLDTVKIYDKGLAILVERRPGVLEELYNKAGYIYELPGDTFDHYDYLWDPEVISFEKEIVPLKREYHENILGSLRKLAADGLLKLYEYPARPYEIPLDNSDLIDRYISFEKQGLEGSIDSLLRVYPEFKEIVDERQNMSENSSGKSHR